MRGIGKATEARVYRGIKYDTSTIERMFITFYCREKYLDPAIKAILESAKTGEVGDGKIFISDIVDAYRIRTGDKGDNVITSYSIHYTKLYEDRCKAMSPSPR